MGKEKYIFNTQTLKYERVKESLNSKLLRLFGFFCTSILTALVFIVLINKFFPSFAQKELIRENKALTAQLEDYSIEVEKFSKELAFLQDKDAYTHRMIFGMDPIDRGIWEGGKGGHVLNEDLLQYKYSGESMAKLSAKVEQLKHQMVVQTHSMDTVLNLAKEKENMWAAMPSIKPVRSDKLKRDMKLLSGYGFRIHPIQKIRKMHWGIDFTAPRGTPIQATGAGRVVKAGRGTGYGNRVEIDHGFGYRTLYAHMHKIDVKIGDNVTRGQKIGTVGNTGASTAPHCHYEVLQNGKKVNPLHYCLDGLTTEEYQMLVDAAQRENQSFD